MPGQLITYFVVQPFRRVEKGHLVPDDPIEAQSRPSAIRRAEGYADRGLAAIAFSRTGDPNLGDWDDAVIIAQCGPIPPGVESNFTDR